MPEVAQAPAAAPSQAVRIVNVIDPGMAADYLNSAAGEKPFSTCSRATVPPCVNC